MQYCFMIFIAFMLSSCGSDSNGGSSGNGVDQPSILNGSQQKYFELNEEQNNDPAFAEETGYSLDTNGIELIGTFSPNSLDIVGDKYLIYSGLASKIDLQVFLNGVGLENNASQVTTRFDALEDDGVSAVLSNSFRNISIFTNTYYLISISIPISDDSALSQPYTIQIRESQ